MEPTDKRIPTVEQWEALKEVIDEGKIKTLTEADYDWPASSPDRIAVWQLPVGYYKVAPGTTLDFNSLGDVDTYTYEQPIILSRRGDGDLTFFSGGYGTGAWYARVGRNVSFVRKYLQAPIDALDSLDTVSPLSANQGRVLKELIDALDAPFTGTDGTTVGTKGLVPAPATTDTDKFLKSDGTWDEISSINSISVNGVTQMPDANKNVDLEIPEGIRVFDVENHTLTEDELQAFKDAWENREPIFIHYGAVGGQIVHSQTGNNLNWGQVQTFSAILGLKGSPVENPHFQSGVVTFTPSTSMLSFSWNTHSSLALEGDSSLTTSDNGYGWVKKSAIKSYIGDLSTLTTTAKTSAVAAINELDSKTSSLEPLVGSGAPTTSTEGTYIGQIYVATIDDEKKVYTLVDIDEDSGTGEPIYIWQAQGGDIDAPSWADWTELFNQVIENVNGVGL